MTKVSSIILENERLEQSRNASAVLNATLWMCRAAARPCRISGRVAEARDVVSNAGSSVLEHLSSMSPVVYGREHHGSKYRSLIAIYDCRDGSVVGLDG